jgi:rhodanese-related sulfurtransferase
MLFDPADFGAIGGDADLSKTIKGFRIIPYPYLGTLPGLPVSGAYEGETAFDVAWDEEGAIISAEPNYLESQMILDDIFPKDKAIFLMCGGGGYSAMTKSLLMFLGWDGDRIYNLGAHWTYEGAHNIELIHYADVPGGNDTYATWRADYTLIDFNRLHSLR